MQNELISVIIPCYNSAKSLARAVDSVTNQVYKNLEIILVNDGSQDETLALATQFSLQDPRIHVISQENQGVSVARNAGLRYASGNLIAFLDSDDNYTSPYALEDMAQLLDKNNADLCVCNFTHPCFEQHLASGLYDLTNHQQFMNYYQDFFACSMPWNKLFRRECITEDFVVNLKFGEDEIFNLANLKNIHKVVVTDQVYYNYYCTPYIPNNNASTISGALRDSDNRDTVWHLFMKNQALREDIINKNFPQYADTMQYIRSFDFFFWVFFLMAKNRVPLDIFGDSYFTIFQDPLFQKSLEVKNNYRLEFTNITAPQINQFCKLAYTAFSDIKTYHKKLSMYKVFLGIFARMFVKPNLYPNTIDMLGRVYVELEDNLTAEAIYTNNLFAQQSVSYEKCLVEWLGASILLQSEEVGNPL